MLMTFADRAMGRTCWYANERQPQATVQLDMHFVDAVQVGESYVGAGAFDFLYKESDGNIYSPATYTRITYPEYIRTSVLQARQSEEFLVSCCAIEKLVKNCSPAPFASYINEADRGRAQLRTDGQYTTMAGQVAGGEITVKQPTR